MANTVISLKKSGTPFAAPATLANGEIALNYADGKLFYKSANGTITSFSSGSASFGTINAAGTLVIADIVDDVLDIRAGENIIITGDAVNDRVTINADLSAANSWSNTKLSNGTGTLAGSLTTTGSITASGYLYINPEGGEEGGEIQLFATGSNTNWSIDSYQNNFRIFARSGSTVSNLNFFHATGGSVRLGVNKTNPDYAIDVTGDVNVSGKFRINGTELSTGTVDLTPANNYAGYMANSSNAYAASLTPDLSPAFNQANSSYIVANAAFDKANTANLLAYDTGIGANNWANTKLANTSGVTFAGDLTISNDLTIGNNIYSINSALFDTTISNIVAAKGQITWNPDDETFDMGMANGATLQVGQEIYYRVKNQTGSTITEGTVVMSSGTLGASGRILVAPAVSDGSFPSKYLMGIATTTMATGEEGYVTHFGKVRGIDTSMWSEGDVLYANVSAPGMLQNTAPVAPNTKTTVAIVVSKSAITGELFVRPTYGSKLNEDELVELSSLADGDLLRYKSANSRFENINENSTGPAINAVAAFITTNAVSVGANAWASSVGTAGNNYTNYVGTSANTYAASLTPDLSPAFNKANDAYTIANAAFDKANSANVLAYDTGIGANAWANTIAVSANNYADTKLANTTNTVFDGNLIISGNVKSTGLQDSSGRLLLIKDSTGTVVWGN